MAQKIILVLDANLTIQKVVEFAFVDTEYQIISLNIDLPTAEDALEKIRNISPHLVLLDFDFPEVGGKVICKRIKEDPSLAHLPVILLVRDLDRYSPKKMQEYGADRILGKPFEAHDLVRIVEECFHPGLNLDKAGQSIVGPNLEEWLRQIVKEKIEEVLRPHLEEIVTERLEKFFKGEEFLQCFHRVFMGSENEIFQNLLLHSDDVIENVAMKIVPEQAKKMIRKEIDKIKYGE